jgi:hypothetical protein
MPKTRRQRESDEVSALLARMTPSKRWHGNTWCDYDERRRVCIYVDKETGNYRWSIATGKQLAFSQGSFETQAEAARDLLRALDGG